MSRAKKWILRIGGFIIVALTVLATWAAMTPIPIDIPVLPEDYGAGAVNILPANTGLAREFPAKNDPAINPSTDRKIELGRLLFFDPILSGNDDLSCASCHHPNLGFADKKQFSVGAAGELTRNTPTLWNVGFADTLFWDGRSNSLEEQVGVAITHPNEMGADEAETVAQLRAIPEYVAMFEFSFGGQGADAVTLGRVEQAVAAFERTLVTAGSPFDRYALGDFEALTDSQRRGLALFRSAATRCFECHALPLFNTETFRVIGVDSDDPGRAGFASDAPNGAFAVPTLRNVALTAPYMHNGSLATLEEVVDFYADGGGRAHGKESVDQFVLGFDLTEQEKSDLVDFLFGLTDEANMPPYPDAVPSGLPVVPPTTNPAWNRVARINNYDSMGEESLYVRPEPVTLRVPVNGNIQEMVDFAQPGDTVVIPYGEYHQTVVIDINDFTLLGEPNADGDYPVLHGDGERSDGVIATGDNFEIGFLEVRHYKSNGILVEGSTGVHIHHVFVEDTGVYGIYPTRSTDILVEDSVAVGMHDAGIYVGKSADAVVRNNEAYGNVLGIEIENTVGADVYGNHVHDNSTGFLIDLLPNLPSKVSLNTKVHDNLIENNNLPNWAPPELTAAQAPAGSGIAILAADGVEVYDNVIRNNITAGIGVFNLYIVYNEDEIDVGPLPENNYIHDNEMSENGTDPQGLIKDMGIPGGDILWDGSGNGNNFDQEGASMFPPIAPTSEWSTASRRIHYHILNFLLKLVG